MRSAGTEGGRRGVVLLEVIVAVAILGIALFALLQAMAQSVSAASSIRNYDLADRLLENLVSELQFPPLEDEEGFEHVVQEGLLEGTLRIPGCCVGLEKPSSAPVPEMPRRSAQSTARVIRIIRNSSMDGCGRCSLSPNLRHASPPRQAYRPCPLPPLHLRTGF